MSFPLVCFFDPQTMTLMITGSQGKGQTRRASWLWKKPDMTPLPWTSRVQLGSAEVRPTIGKTFWLLHCSFWPRKVIKAAGHGKKDWNCEEKRRRDSCPSVLQMASPSVASLHPRSPLVSLASWFVPCGQRFKPYTFLVSYTYAIPLSPHWPLVTYFPCRFRHATPQCMHVIRPVPALALPHSISC